VATARHGHGEREIVARLVSAEQIDRLLDVDQPLVVLTVLTQVLPIEHRGHR